MTFPDTIPSEESNIWATMIPSRNPEFKVHRAEGLANAAMGNRATHERFAKYELVDLVWTKRFEYIPRDKCDRCDFHFGDVSKGRPSRRNRQTYNYVGPQYLAPVICDNCETEDRETKRRIATERHERETLARLQAKYNN